MSAADKIFFSSDALSYIGTALRPFLLIKKPSVKEHNVGSKMASC